jgi:hypothetical protein
MVHRDHGARFLDFRTRAKFELLKIANQTSQEGYMDAERPFLAKRVQIPSPEWDTTSNAIRRAMRLTAELNKLSFDDAAKVRAIFSELTGDKVDETFHLIPPFYTASGLEIRVGRRVFINQCCTIL